MAKNKKQHFVPQFYLKFFSWGNKKAINIYNISKQKIILGGSLKDQCYETYFYGKNLDVENAFGYMEDGVSRIIAQIIDSSSAPKHDTSEYCDILAYTLFQLARTKKTVEEEEELTNTVFKSILEDAGTITREVLDQLTIKSENPTAIPLITIAPMIPIAMDLVCKVLINKTNTNFIISDNPVVLYNRACEQSKVFSHTGLASKGLKIIFPISPKHALLFYDEKIYKVGERKRFYADVTRDDDVRQFNDLQWLNALENIYFNDASLRPEILRGANKNIKKRNTKKVYTNECQVEAKTNGTQNTFLLVQKPDLNIQMNIHCIRQLRAISNEEMNNGAKSIRDPGLYTIHSEFLRLVYEGKYKASEFGVFIKNKLG